MEFTQREWVHPFSLCVQVWTYRNDSSKLYTFPESDVGEYEITITPNSGLNPLLLDVQVTKKWIPHSS